MMKNFFVYFALLTLVPVSALSAVKVTVSGCFQGVEPPMEIQSSKPIRLLTVLVGIPHNDCNYFHGASLLQKRLLAEQVALRKSIIKLLAGQIDKALRENNKEALSALEGLKDLVSSQQVTGRLPLVDFNPTRVETSYLKNILLTQDTEVFIPSRDQPVYLVGFPTKQIPFDPELSIQEIYRKFELDGFYKKGWLQAVQPNGEVKVVKVGDWHHLHDYIAPGGWVIGVLPAEWAHVDAQDLNHLILKWLSLQVPGHE